MSARNIIPTSALAFVGAENFEVDALERCSGTGELRGVVTGNRWKREILKSR